MQIARRVLILLTFIVVLVFVAVFQSRSLSVSNLEQGSTQFSFNPQFEQPDRVIMSKMGNETLRAQLGRASWHLLHTMSVKYPLNPTRKDQQDYLSLIKLIAQFYPCGDCAAHFQRLLVKLPPRVGNREEVIQWTCEIHNLVNERLEKPVFNCSTVGDMWKCGCAEEELKG